MAEIVTESVTEEDVELPVCAMVGTELGATYNPVGEIAPHAVPPRVQAICQVTEVFEVPVTAAVNCTLANVKIEGKFGEITTLGPIVAEAVPVSAGLAAAIAVMVTTVGLGIVAGAVYAPKVEMVPMVEFPPAIPFTCQVTLLLLLPVTVAWKVCGVPAGTIAVDGVTVTVTVGKGVGPPPPPPPQAIKRHRNPAANMEKPHAFIHTRSLGKHPWFRYFTPVEASRPAVFIYSLHPCLFGLPYHCFGTRFP